MFDSFRRKFSKRTNLSADAQQIVAAAQRFQRELYKTAQESEFHLIRGGPFEWCDGGRRMWKLHLTDDYARLMIGGPDNEAYRGLVQARAHINELPDELVRHKMAEERRVLVAPSSASDLLKAAIAEITSPFEGEPGSITVLESGQHQITISDPIYYVEIASDKLAKMMGFLHAFGTDENGKLLPSMDDIYAQLDSLEERAVQTGEDRADVLRLIREPLGFDPTRYQTPQNP